MGKKADVFDPNPPYQGCDSQITRESIDELKNELKAYEKGDHVAEEKLDGQWAEIRIVKGKVTHIISRGGILKDFEPLLNHSFPTHLTGSLIGEISHGSSCPKMLLKTAVIFDYLQIEFKSGSGVIESDSRCEQWHVRRSLLERLGGWTDKVCLVEVRKTGFLEFYLETVKAEGEGLIIKQTHGNDTFYVPASRSPIWTKVKKNIDVDMVVMGVEWREAEKMSELTKSKGMDAFIHSIIVGQYFDGKLKKCCKVGSMSDEARTWFTKNHKEAVGKVVVIHGFGQFPTGAVRHPSVYQPGDLKTLFRDDKKPTDCRFGDVRMI